jgi:hypothetical protein
METTRPLLLQGRYSLRQTGARHKMPMLFCLHPLEGFRADMFHNFGYLHIFGDSFAASLSYRRKNQRKSR